MLSTYKMIQMSWYVVLLTSCKIQVDTNSLEIIRKYFFFNTQDLNYVLINSLLLVFFFLQCQKFALLLNSTDLLIIVTD